MKDKGMLPLPLAYEIKREIYDFLNVSFEIKATKSGEALRKYYTSDNELVKGPFVKVSLPYEASKSIDDSPLQLKMNFPPYKHQINAFTRLSYNQALNTIVTTGTGSGKTECFLYPLLDYVKNLKESKKGDGGLKAIILYPMNALLDDQAIRFAKAIKQHGLESLNLRVGKYTGFNGKTREMDFKRSRVIDHRDEIVRNPPDILLTNYKMLDYMLFREQEKSLWNEETKKYLKYLVLDEMHTFDGAQGADVACLIRRLKDVSKAADNMTFVGTSATLSSSENAKDELCEFASSLFGSDFDKDSIIEETKHTVDSYIGEGYSVGFSDLPSDLLTGDSIVSYEYGESINAYVEKILKIFGKEELIERRPEIGKFLSELEIFVDIIKVCTSEILSVGEIIEKIILLNPKYSEVPTKAMEQVVISLLTLASYARHSKIPGFPFLTIKASLWASELRHTLAKVVGVEENWVFVDESDVINSQELYLPSVYCGHCGEAGWASYYTENEETTIKNLTIKPHTIRSQYAKGKGCILFPVSDRTSDIEDIVYLYRDHRKLVAVDEGEEDGDKPIPVVKALVKEGRCPACDTKLQVRFFSLGSSSLASVIATSCFSHSLNQDRKLISFSDSVQDASHQASFLNNRSFSFSFKKFISSKLSEGVSLSIAQKLILPVEDTLKLDRNGKVDVIGKFAPDKLRKKWQVTGLNEVKEPTQNMMKSLSEVVEYNTFQEFTFNSRFGWSFEKVGHSGFFIDDSKLKSLIEQNRSEWIEHDVKYQVFSDDRLFRQFLYGFIQRLKVSGAVYLSYLDRYYSDKRASYWIPSQIYNDLPLGEYKLTKPKFFSPQVDSSITRKQNYETLGSKNSWYWRWLNKFCETNRVSMFYEEVSNWLLKHGIFVRVGHDKETGDFIPGKPRYVLSPDILVYKENLIHFECEKCKTRLTAPIYLKEDLTGSSCTQRFCSGNLGLRDTVFSGKYFQRYFKQDTLRINASEHTGSFDSTLKGKVEDEFKKNETLTPNYDTNYLSCTPTMEMGIDIGDLSSVILKSVPRNAASYFQRIGRSGRTTGNSLDFLVIDKKPHNMYFWLQPRELLDWEVVTPSCRYKTEHILQRQYNAYIMDQYLHTSESETLSIPKSFSWLDGLKDEDKGYWSQLFDFEKNRREKLLNNFLELFQLESDPVGESIKDYVLNDGVFSSFNCLFEKISKELSELDQNILEFRHEISKINPKDEYFFEKLDKAFKGEGEHSVEEILLDFDESTKTSVIDLYGSITSSRKKREGMLNARTSNVLSKLSDTGVLPGYAFPEEGCELEFNIRKPLKKGSTVKDPFYTVSLSRSPETALRDLAPYNHFYTHGYEAQIDRIGIFGKKEPFVNIGSCFNCGHVTTSKLCEVCNVDVELIPSYDFKKAKATSNFHDSYVSDSKESRETERYEIERKFLFDSPVTSSNRKAISFYNEESQFGYEFQTNVKIYTFNLGHKVSSDKVNPFKVCRTCGAVENPKERKTRKDKGLPLVNHYKSCSSNNEDLESITLYRQIESDAVRIPVLNPNLIPIMRTVLKRGVELHLKGDTGHISISDYSQDGYEGNTFIVIYDNVPGGTGHLRDLFGVSLTDDDKSSPAKFLSMLQDVLAHVSSCSCDDGCYHCVWSSENIQHKEKVTKKGTIFHLKRLISQSVDDFIQKESGLLDIVREHSFDGQTEAMLFHALNSIGPKITSEEYRFEVEECSGGAEESIWKIKFKDSFCYLKSSPYESISLGEAGATKPDFHVLDKEKSVVGFIYTDGSRFHLNPGQESTIFEQDIKLRKALMKQKKVPVLTFTYRELDELGVFVTSEDEALKSKGLYQFNVNTFDVDHAKSSGLFLGTSSRLNLTISILLRLFKFAGGTTSELSENEVVPSFLPWLTNYESHIMYFDKETKTLKIKTDVNLRSEFNRFNQVDTISEEYYLSWISFWQMFNVISMAKLLRSKIDFDCN